MMQWLIVSECTAAIQMMQNAGGTEFPQNVYEKRNVCLGQINDGFNNVIGDIVSALASALVTRANVFNEVVGIAQVGSLDCIKDELSQINPFTGERQQDISTAASNYGEYYY